jgi:hypothetical protein
MRRSLPQKGGQVLGQKLNRSEAQGGQRAHVAHGSNPDHSFSARMSPSAECGHRHVRRPRCPKRRSKRRSGLFRRACRPTRLCADAAANVAMTMRSPLSPAADMPPHWLWAAMCRYCSLIPGFGVKLSAIILAGPTVLSAVGACPPHDGVRRRWWINVASAVSLRELAKNRAISPPPSSRQGHLSRRAAGTL